MSSDDWRVSQLESELQSLKNEVNSMKNSSPPVINSADLDYMGWIDPNGMFMTSLGQALQERANGGFDDVNLHTQIQAYIKEPFQGRMVAMRREIADFRLE